MTTASTFETLPIPQKGTPPTLAGSSYRVYKDAKEFVTVKAATALEAFEASGLKEAYKIERDRLDSHAVIGSGSWKEKDAAPPPAAAAAEAAPAAAAEAAPPATPS